jgi:hypothetical protein
MDVWYVYVFILCLCCHLTTLWASRACYRDTFTFYLLFIFCYSICNISTQQRITNLRILSCTRVQLERPLKDTMKIVHFIVLLLSFHLVAAGDRTVCYIVHKAMNFSFMGSIIT